NAAAMESLGASGVSTLLFAPAEPLSDAARAYIAMGEKLQIDARYKCRKRSPWWKVPLPPVPDAFITYMNSFGPNICGNEVSVPSLNCCHGIRFHDELRERGCAYLPMASFNSATLLSAELIGRSYGGGIQKLEPREAARLAVPSPCVIDTVQGRLSSARDEFDALLSRGEYETASELVDGIVLSGAMGLGDEEIGVIRGACKKMRDRRRNRVKAR
ncbi:DNA methylase, partial [gut metagenome]